MEHHTSLVSFADILFAYNKFDSVPTFRLVKPLVGINAYLGSKRLGQNQDISNDCRVGAEIEVILVNFIACKIQFSIKNQIYSYFENNYILWLEMLNFECFHSFHKTIILIKMSSVENN